MKTGAFILLSPALALISTTSPAAAKLAQTIPDVEITVKVPEAVPFTLPATTSAGLPVVWESLTGPATVSGSTVTLTGGTGAVTLRGRQAGDASHDPAPDHYETFIVGTGGGFLKIAAGYAHAVGIRPDGYIWTWGLNDKGQLGDGTTTRQATPKRIPGDAKWVSAAGGGAHTVAIREDKTLWAWGDNSRGQLGIGNSNISSRAFATQVGNLTNWKGVACGENHTVAWTSDGRLFAWGKGTGGQIGDNNLADRNAPVRIGSDFDWIEASCGQNHTLGRRTSKTVWAWGNNDYGQLGDGSNTTRKVPTQVMSGVSNWAGVSAGLNFSVARRSDGTPGGTLWSWGDNSSGQLGDGTTDSANAPRQVGTDTDWTTVSCGSAFAIAQKSDNWMWAWGYNSAGQLGLTGDSAQIDQGVPVRTMLGPWGSVGTGAACVLAVRNEALWSWGTNDSSQLALPPEITGQAVVPPAPRVPLRSPQAINAVASVVRQTATLTCSAGSFLPAAVTVVSGPAVLGADGATLSFTGEGGIVVKVSQPGDGSWDPAEEKTLSFQSDGTGPVFTTPPADIIVQATGADGAMATFDKTAADAVSGSAAVISVPASGTLFPAGRTQVTSTATDAVGNPTVQQFNVIVNRPPLAAADTAGTTQGIAVTLNPRKLSINDRDPDGDALSITAVSPTSAHGTISLGAGKIVYTPEAGFSGTDSFTYILTDAHGGTATGIVNVTVAPASAVSQNSVMKLTANGMELSFAGVPGSRYLIQYSSNLTDWQTLAGPVTADERGGLSFTDPPPLPPRRYYRTITSPMGQTAP